MFNVLCSARTLFTEDTMDIFYRELAPFWSLISPVEEYADEAQELVRLLRARRPDARTLLELGSGGGHLAHFLAKEFQCHLTDMSPEMLELSRALNPECTHSTGDMRTLDLQCTFDLVLAHDAIDYMTTEDDLRAAIDTAWRHLSPGGLACFVPDDVAESFEPGTDVSGGDAVDGRGARLFEWAEKVEPGQTVATVHYSFLIRSAEGQVQQFYEKHLCGLFPRATWERLLVERGFRTEVVVEATEEEREGRLVFLAHRPIA
jgi:SAM-dependent methyltransferase